MSEQEQKALILALAAWRQVLRESLKKRGEAIRVRTYDNHLQAARFFGVPACQ